jgi:predicted RNase H-like HicB family nuclease
LWTFAAEESKESSYRILNHGFDDSMKIKAVIHPAEEGGYWAEVPALPGCITEGDTIEEVMANLKDAIEGWLDVANSRQMAQSTDQVVEIAV